MKIVLKAHETMKQRRAQDRLDIDAANVHRAVRSTPGIASKRAIGALVGLSQERVTEVIERINRGETSHGRMEFGVAKARGGPNAGEEVRGWFLADLKSYVATMDQADDAAASREAGIRRARLVRLAQARDMRFAEAVVDSLLERLGLSAEAMSLDDIEAFEELLAEAAEDGSE